MNDDIKWYELASTYVGGVIGAGFASGQETLCFFYSLGLNGIKAVITAGVLFAIIGAVILLKITELRSSSYKDFLSSLNHGPITKIADVCFALIPLGVLTVMLAGSGALFQEYFGVDYILGVISIGICVIGVVRYGSKGVLSVNNILVPGLVIIIILIGVIIMLEGHSNSQPIYYESVSKSWIGTGLLYSTYNIVLIFPLLAGFGHRIPSRTTAVLGGISGGLCLGVLGYIIYMVILLEGDIVTNYEIPMLYILSSFGKIPMYVYALMIWICMLTTAIGCTYGFVARAKAATGFGYMFLGVMAVLTTIPISIMGFAPLVGSVYPVIGYIGIIILGIFVFLSFLSGKDSYPKHISKL